jgi:hypothetical protein
MSPFSWQRVPYMPAELIWTLCAISVAAFLVQITGTGLDILALMLFGAVIVGIDHAFGDGMSDLVGPNLWGLFLALLAVLSIGSLARKNAVADSFFQSAEQVGYRTLYYDTSPAGSALRRSGTTASSSGAAPIAESAPAPADAVPMPTQGQSPAPLPAFRAPWSGPAVTSQMRLLTDEISTTGAKVRIRAYLFAADAPIPSAEISFTVDERPLGVVKTNSKGVATVYFTTRAPGRYQVRARFDASAEFRACSSAAILHVLPASRR